MDSYDVIVIGAASAGLSAALYLSRQNLKTLVISKDIGGQALLTNEIENYPGFDYISGFDLMNKFHQQASKYGTEFVYDEVVSVSRESDGVFLVSTNESKFRSTALVLAFGKTPRNLNVPGEDRLAGHGVSYCAVCDGPLYKGKEIAVVGIGDHVLQEAVYLSSAASKLHIIYTGSRVDKDDENYKQLISSEKNKFYLNSIVKEINGDKLVKSVKVLNRSSSPPSEFELKIDGLFVEMGYIAKSDFVKDLVKLNSSKEIITDKLGNTSSEGIFACGDITDIPYKQAVISAGQGATAALSAFNYIQKKKGLRVMNTDWKTVKTDKVGVSLTLS
ncbi:MAG: FAD-dependent oxidoreductase [Thermoplasmatales archaeon]|nr:FAD-dependent oxidoreductase [Thermoplasmatales archaeon]MCW6169832.1 FAD-dependent oxidoreductase [Thermoplasmatales archaeon]